MTNIYGLLSIGQSALLTQQKAIDITGNNIANVNTPGYSRQRLNIKQNTPVRDDGQTMSTGVTADTGIQRFYDQFLGAQLNGENESLGRWEAQKQALERAELMFDDSESNGLSSAMGAFWNAWQDLSNNPSGVAERTSLISAGQYLATTFNQTYNNLRDLQSDIDTHVTNIVSDVNEISDRIAELNRKVNQVEVTGHNANDFRDERDQLVLELSKLIEVQSFEDGDGNINVSVGSGKPLVDGTATWDLTTADNGGVQDVFWQAADGSTVNITGQITSGELKGWIYTRDTSIDDYLTRLDTLATNIMSEVNTLHAAGTTLDSVTTTGVNFFTGSGAVNMTVNSAIEANSDLIAAAGAGEGLPGGNSVAIAIAGLQSAATMPGSSTFDAYYNSLAGQVGADVQAADFNQNHQETMVKNLKEYRQEVSGVSLDEEMVNLIQFQQAYSAAAKLITTADEMVDTLLSMVR
ncbi:MAG: flagellar hook-associated protein FlgK [Desulfobacteraceae bacterium]|jgi:flagellar hook-associated protein 1 FlgK